MFILVKILEMGTKRAQMNKKIPKPLFIRDWGLKSDLDWIQTSNLLSRNQVRYSVAPRGLFCGCKYRYNCVTCKPKLI